MNKKVVHIATGEAFENRLCEILGIEPTQTALVDIRVRPGMPVIITIETFATTEQVDAFLSLVDQSVDKKSLIGDEVWDNP